MENKTAISIKEREKQFFEADGTRHAHTGMSIENIFILCPIVFDTLH